MEFLHPAHDHDIDFVRWLLPAMWHVALESWQWIHQVAAPCSMIRGSGMTCHWIRPNFCHIGILHLVSISTYHRSRHVILYQSEKFYPNRTTLSRKNDVMWRRFSRWRISAILDCRDPIMGSLKSPCTISYRSSIDTIALNCLVFEKIAFFCILATDRQTDGLMDKQMDSSDALSRSRCSEQRFNNRPLKRLPLVARLPPAFYIGLHAG